MTAPVLIAVGLIGGLGALGRFLLDRAVSARLGQAFPFGTLAVNLTGALLLGLVVGAALTGEATRVLGTGLLGAYTTFSTWVFESQRLAQDGRRRLAALNLGVSLLLGLGAAWLGRRVGASV